MKQMLSYLRVTQLASSSSQAIMDSGTHYRLPVSFKSPVWLYSVYIQSSSYFTSKDYGFMTLEDLAEAQIHAKYTLQIIATNRTDVSSKNIIHIFCFDKFTVYIEQS